MWGWYEMQKANLVNYFQSKLEYSRVPSRSHSTKIACSQIGADTAILARASKLRVVPGVKAFCPEFHSAAASFAEHKFFEPKGSSFGGPVP
jgi:hypothetical protein